MHSRQGRRGLRWSEISRPTRDGSCATFSQQRTSASGGRRPALAPLSAWTACRSRCPGAERAGGLASVLPRGFATAVCVGSPSPEPLFPSEAASSAPRSIDAGSSLLGAQLRPPRHGSSGAPAAPILATPQRAPIWPAGLVGSISHASSTARAAIGWADDWAAVGVDVEVLHQSTPTSSGTSCHLRSGARWNGSIDASRGPASVFSIKEAMYKL